MVIETYLSVGVGSVEELFQASACEQQSQQREIGLHLFPFTISCPSFSAANYRLEAAQWHCMVPLLSSQACSIVFYEKTFELFYRHG